MSKPPKIVVPGLNRGAGIAPGFVIGRRRGVGRGPAELLDLPQLQGLGLATGAQVAQSIGALSTALSATTRGGLTMLGMDGEDGQDGISLPGTPGAAGAAGPAGATGPQGPAGFGLDGQDADDSGPIFGPGASQAALDGKANLSGGNTFTGTQNVADVVASGNVTANILKTTSGVVQRADGNAIFSSLAGSATFFYSTGVGVYEFQDAANNALLHLFVDTTTYVGVDSLTFRDKTTLVDFRVDIDTTGLNLRTGKALSYNGTAVISGGLLTAAGFPALTGDVVTTAGSLATTIPAGTVTLAKMANMPSGSLIYRRTAGSGVPEVNALATLKTDLGFTGPAGFALDGLDGDDGMPLPGPIGSAGPTGATGADGSSAIYELAPTKPAAADFTLQNGAGGTTAATIGDYTSGVFILQNGTPGATGQIRFARHNTVSVGQAFTMTARLGSMDPSQPYAQAQQGALILRNSANGRMILYGNGNSDVNGYIQIFSGYTSGQLGQYSAFSVMYQFPWKRIVSDGTNLTFFASKDGYYWVPAGAGTTIANYLGALDEAGIGVQSIPNVATPHGTVCQSFTFV